VFREGREVVVSGYGISLWELISKVSFLFFCYENLLTIVRDISLGRSRPSPLHPPHHRLLLPEALPVGRGSPADQQ
jgi:hypothetical protein